MDANRTQPLADTRPPRAVDWPPTATSAVGPAATTVVRATGADRLSYLDDVLSQRLRDVTPGTATHALELGPNGEPTGVLQLAVLADQVVVLVDDHLAEEVVGRLAGRTFLSDVTFTADDEVEVRRLRGPQAHEDAAAAGLATPVGTASVDDRVLRLGDDHGLVLVGPPDALDEVVAALRVAGVETGAADRLDALELLTGRPRPPEEIARGRLPEELGLLPTHVHLDKGCYPGQEAVARMWQLGRPRRRLAVLESLAGPLTPGTIGSGADRVEVTRVGEVEARRVALAFVGRDRRVGEEVGDGVLVRALVGEGRPVPGHDPAVRRRRDTR